MALHSTKVTLFSKQRIDEEVQSRFLGKHLSVIFNSRLTWNDNVAAITISASLYLQTVEEDRLHHEERS